MLLSKPRFTAFNNRKAYPTLPMVNIIEIKMKILSFFGRALKLILSVFLE